MAKSKYARLLESLGFTLSDGAGEVEEAMLAGLPRLPDVPIVFKILTETETEVFTHVIDETGGIWLKLEQVGSEVDLASRGFVDYEYFCEIAAPGPSRKH